jgi:serine protease Do
LTRSNGSYLGIGVAEITPERARALNLREERGVEITRVEEESPAAKAGLKQGDVVLEYSGQRVEGVEQFMRIVRETPPGREVRLSVYRNGAAQQITVRTAARKAWFSSRSGEHAVEIPRIELPEIRIPDVPRPLMSWRSSFLGIEAESLDAQLAEYFGVKEGVLVRSVASGSPAEKAGLRAGDVIVRVEDKTVSTPGEVSSAVRSARSKKSVTPTAVRDKKEMLVALPTEELGREQFHAVPRIAGPRR